MLANICKKPDQGADAEGVDALPHLGLPAKSIFGPQCQGNDQGKPPYYPQAVDHEAKISLGNIERPRKGWVEVPLCMAFLFRPFPSAQNDKQHTRNLYSCEKKVRKTGIPTAYDPKNGDHT